MPNFRDHFAGMADPRGSGMTRDPSGRRQAVITCPGDVDDPKFPGQCKEMLDKLQTVLRHDEICVVKCEPWNSVKITFDLPAEAAEKLSALAEAGDDILREMGILSLQIQGGKIISMTLDIKEEPQDCSNKSGAGMKRPAESLLVNLLQKDCEDTASATSSSGGSGGPPSEKKRRKHPSSSSSSTPKPSVDNGYPALSDTPIRSHHHHHSHLHKSASSSSAAAVANTHHSGMVVSRTMMPPPQAPSMLGATPASSSPALAGATGTMTTITREGQGREPKKATRHQILINPNTGVLESGPSESSSEGEAEPDNSAGGGGMAGTPGGADYLSSPSDKALKLKLKLPVEKRSVSASGGSASGHGSGGGLMPSKKEVPLKMASQQKLSTISSSSGSSDCEPKLPKLILSMRDKTVKQKFSAAAAAAAKPNSSGSDGAAQPMVKLLKSGRTFTGPGDLVSSVKTEQASSSSKSEVNHTTKAKEEEEKVNFMRNPPPPSTASISGGVVGASSKKPILTKEQLQSERLNVWAKSLIREKQETVEDAFHHDDDDGDIRVNHKDAFQPNHVKPERLRPDLSNSQKEDSTAVGDVAKTEPPETFAPNNHAPSLTAEEVKQEEADLLSSPPASLAAAQASPTPDHSDGKSDDLGNAASSNTPPSSSSSSSNGNGSHDTGVPPLPLPRGEPDSGAHQQGEDSGIESMDTLSEKSPNQGETSYPNEEKIERELSSSVPSTVVPGISALLTTTATTTVHSVNLATAPSSSTSSSSGGPGQSNSQGGHPPQTTSSSTTSSAASDTSGSTVCDTPAQNGTSVTLAKETLAAPLTIVEQLDRSRSSTPEPLGGNGPNCLRGSPILTNGIGGSSNGGGVHVRSTINVPPGAKMVPVKLVSVSGEGNMRLVRVSPVKTSAMPHSHVDTTSVLGTRTVIIKSSSLKQTVGGGTSSPSSVVTTTPTLLPSHLVSSQPLSPSLLSSSTSSGSMPAGSTNGPSPPSAPSKPPIISLPTMGPSLSIMPVWDPQNPPQPSAMGNMSMRDVVESIAAKNKYQQPDKLDSSSVDPTINAKPKGVNRSRPPPSSGMVKRAPQQQQGEFVGGGSLLKPLLAPKEEPPTAVTTVTSTLHPIVEEGGVTTTFTTSASTTLSALTVVDSLGKGKRRRRDTDSSTKSDKSDASSGSTMAALNNSTTSSAPPPASSSSSSSEAKKTNSKPGPLVALERKAAKVKAEDVKAKAAASKGVFVRNKKEEPVQAKEDKSGSDEATATAAKVVNAVKKSARAENARNKAALLNASAVAAAAAAKLKAASSDLPEASRRSVRQQTPPGGVSGAGGATPTRPPSARQQTPTRQTANVKTSTGGNSGGSGQTNSSTPAGVASTLPSSASSTSLAINKAKRNSGGNNSDLNDQPPGSTNSLTSLGPAASNVSSLANDNAKLHLSATPNASSCSTEKRMKTRSAKASDEPTDTKRRRLKMDTL